jgi:tetratricopeptide (TPR) repeat protein
VAGAVHIRASRPDGDVHLTHVTAEGHREATVHVDGVASPSDAENIRWYLEDYLMFRADPAPAIAREIEERIQEIGVALFRSVFEANQDAARIWAEIRNSLPRTRFLIRAGAVDVARPWELLRSPLDTMPLACRAQAFARVSDGPQPLDGPRRTGPLRVLLVVARIAGAADIRFRAVAARVLHRLAEHPAFEFEVLRPATFEALESRLRTAYAEGRPYTIVHFDGHGIHDDLVARHTGRSPRHKRGYLLFEDPETETADPVDGVRFAELLTECAIPVVVLNACRSARAENQAEEPGAATSFRSLAEEMTAAGVQAVVAMQYNVYVDSAARFVAGVYDALARGELLAEAFATSCGALWRDAEPADWLVPVLFEAAPVVLEIGGADLARDRNRVDVAYLPPPPPRGFVGRDDTLLALDRAFLETRVVRLWGEVGAGKTAIASEFGRWLAQTGGVGHAVVFTSLAERPWFFDVLDAAAAAYQAQLAGAGADWAALTPERRVPELVAAMRASPCLWIWDAADDVLASDEAGQWADLLRQASQAGVRFLLTGRAPELDGLAGLARPLPLPAMDDAERIEFLLEGDGNASAKDVPVWRPLLDRSQGNPLVLSVLIGQAEQAGAANSAAAMTAFLDGVRDDGPGLLDESLDQALRLDFTAGEQAVLSLCALFETVVHEHALDLLTAKQQNPGADLAQLMGARPETSAAPILRRAARIGLLTERGSGYYAIHPALAAHLRGAFGRSHGVEDSELLTVTLAEFHASLARVFTGHHNSDLPDAAETAERTLEINEANLVRAFEVCRERQMWWPGTALLHGLQFSLGRAQRWSRLAALVDAIEPKSAGGPDEGRQVLLDEVRQIRVDLLRHTHRLAEARRLQAALVGEARDRPDDPRLVQRLHDLAVIERDSGSPDCLAIFEEALDRAQRGRDPRMERIIAYGLAGAYQRDDLRDLDQAEYWLTYALDLMPDYDPVGRGTIYSGLGGLVIRRLQTGEADSVTRAIGWLGQALQLLPEQMVAPRAACRMNLGLAQVAAGVDMPGALYNLQEALAFYETTADTYHAGVARLNVALIYRATNDRERSLRYADAAARSFASIPPNAEDDLLTVQDLIAGWEEQPT